MSDEDEVEEVEGNLIEEADLDDEPERTIAEDVLEYLARSVVSDPDAVNVDVDERGNRIRMTVTVGDGDMGRVIGRRGRIANSIRTIVTAAAARDDVEVEVEFED